jgi:hypothetical protein
MGTEKMPQFPSADGCVYMFSQAEKRWYKFCPAEALPLDVKTQVRDLKEKAEALKDA